MVDFKTLRWSVVAAVVGVALASTAFGDDLDRLSDMDRATQLSAVSSLITADDLDQGRIVELWYETKRPDVRGMIARVLADRPDDGVDILLEIASGKHPLHPTEERYHDLIAWALAAHGQAGVFEFAEADPDEARAAGKIAADAARLVVRDIDAFALALLDAREPGRQALALNHFSGSFDGPSVSMRIVAMCRRGDKRVRHAAAGALPVWTAEQRAADPRGFEVYRRALEQLLGNGDAHVATKAMRAIEANGGATLGAANTLKRIMRRSSRQGPRRYLAMRLYLMIERPERAQMKAVEDVVDLVDKTPTELGDVLTLIEPKYFTDDHLLEIIEQQERVYRNEPFDALMTAVPGDDIGALERREALSRRVLPMLIDKVRRDGLRSIDGAQMLAKLTHIEAHAVDELIEIAETGDTRLWYPLVAVAGNDPRVQLAVEQMLQPQDPSYEPIFNPRWMFTGLAEHTKDPAWVGRLLSPVARNRNHKLHVQIERFRNPELLIPMGGYRAVVFPSIVDDHERQEFERLIVAGQLEASDSLMMAEQRRRISSAGAIVRHPSPPREAIDPLVRALARLPLDEPEPSRWTKAGQSADDYHVRRMMRHWDMSVGHEVSRALAHVLAHHPRMIERVIDSLSDRPAALAWTLATHVDENQTQGPAFVPVPEGLDDGLQRAVVDAFLDAMKKRGVDRHYDRPYALALAMAPIEDPATLPRMIAASRLGPSYEAVADAIEGLGHLRPVTSEAIEAIREALEGPPLVERSAAVRAAKALGPAGSPLLDELFALERERLAFNVDPLEAIRAIAPNDPRIAKVERAR